MESIKPSRSDYARYLNIAWPSALEGLLVQAFSFVDLMMVSSLGAGAIAGVGIIGQPKMVVITITRAYTYALTILLGYLEGEDDQKAIHTLQQQAIKFGTISLLIILALFYYFLEDILYLAGAQTDYINQAMEYGQWATLSYLFSMFNMVLHCGYMSRGDSKFVLKANIYGNLVNVVLNACLIYGLGPFPEMGVKGAGISTAIGALFSTLYTVYDMDKRGDWEGFWSNSPITKKFTRDISTRFWGIFMEQGSERIGMILYTRMVADLGTVAFASHNVVMNITNLYYSFCMGLNKASMVISSQAYGARDKNEYDKSLKIGYNIAFWMSIIPIVVIMVFKRQILGLFTGDQAVIEVGLPLMNIAALSSLPSAIAMVSTSALRGTGRVREVAAFSFLSITFIRPIVTYILLYKTSLGVLGAWYSLLLDQSLRCIMSTTLIFRYRNKDWQ